MALDESQCLISDNRTFTVYPFFVSFSLVVRFRLILQILPHGSMEAMQEHKERKILFFVNT